MSSEDSSQTSKGTAVTSAISRAVEVFVMVFIIGMMLLTVADVFLRYAFNSPIYGGTEVTQFLMLIVACAGIILCTIIKGHIKVDLFSKLIPPIVWTISEILFYLLGLGLFFYASWQTFPVAREQQLIHGQSDLLDIPLFPFYVAVAITWGLVALALLIFIIQNIIQVTKR